MSKYKLIPIVALLAYACINFAINGFNPDGSNVNYRPGGRSLLAAHIQDDATTSAPEECSVVDNDVGLPYNTFVYCIIGNVAGAMVILVIWWLLLFSGLATCADEYFCPALVVISNGLGLSPNVAGVTLLALGNGAPDFFAAFSALSGSGGSELGIGAIFGAAIFVTTILIGVIGAVKPFKASERPFLRDIIFYIAAVYWGFYMLWRKKIYFWECIGYIILYVVYVVVVIISSSVYKRRKAAKNPQASAKLTRVTSLKVEGAENRAYVDDTQSGITLPMSIDGAPSLPPKVEISTDGGENVYESTNESGADDSHMYTSFKEASNPPLKETSDNTDNAKDEDNNRLALNQLSVIGGNDLDNISAQISPKDLDAKDDTSYTTSEDKGDPEPSTLSLLLYGICPVNIAQWPEMSIPGKCYAVFKSPMVFVLTLACPVVNYDDSENHNWNRPLQTLQLFLSPSLCTALIGASTVMIGDVFPVIGITFIIGAILAAINFFLTSNFPRPKYHNIFSIYGFIAALIMIYVIANEIVGFLQTFGQVTNINSTILGLTFLAWGNSMGDLMANVVMARQGFPKMSFAACFGASLFNLTLGFGFSMMVKMITSGDSEAPLEFGPVELILSAFLLFSLAVNLVGISMFQRFRITRPYGGILLGLYLVFLVVVVLTGTEVILKDLVL